MQTVQSDIIFDVQMNPHTVLPSPPTFLGLAQLIPFHKFPSTKGFIQFQNQINKTPNYSKRLGSANEIPNPRP